MFYDDAFRRITEGSAFSQKADIALGPLPVQWQGEDVIWKGEEVVYESGHLYLHGIFCSGNYGFTDFDKGYSKKKGEALQSFKISKSSLPTMITPSDLIRKTLVVNSRAWTIRAVSGNDSGILNLELVPGEAEYA